jgi:exosortase
MMHLPQSKDWFFSGLKVAQRGWSVACWAMLGLAFLLLYAHTLRGLLGDWRTDPDYSHGLIVPFVALYLLYLRRAALASIPAAPRIAIGTVVIGFSQLMFLAGYLGAEFFLQRSSIVLLFAGCALLFFGWNHLKIAALSLFLLQLCIPLPTVLLYQITGPLQSLVSSNSEMILRAAGIPVFRSGNILQLSTMTLNIAEACSGIRSLVSLITLAVIMASFSRLSRGVRVFFVLSAAGVAIVANTFRVSCTGLLGYYVRPELAMGYWHLAGGWIVFVSAFLLLALEMHLLQRLNRARSAA